ncbi:hypothetical protein SASPL_121634 [Salvia splendens]|uniref:X8 domain-containing protein n=1 Tax=Salvia splendens TaxID=180675 RepID=A0A8X8ZW94_SALSN|nr:hypothetical protein SASPL_121634 [Salvia splendens]
MTTNSPTPSGRSWCIATSSVSQAALQLALDYACGHGGADCQRNPIPTSCNFGGARPPPALIQMNFDNITELSRKGEKIEKSGEDKKSKNQSKTCESYFDRV